jgi:hypothetical protein
MESNLISVSMDYVKYKSKPSTKPEVDIGTGKTSFQVAQISKRIAKHVEDLTFNEFVEAIGSGRTFLQSVFGICPTAGFQRRLESLFLYCQLATVDFDNGVKGVEPGSSDQAYIDELLNRFPEFSLIYRTFSYTEERPKFRGVILFQERLRNRELAKRFNLGMLTIFPEADQICKDLTRMNFGTSSEDNVIYKAYNPISFRQIDKVASLPSITLSEGSSSTSENLKTYEIYECEYLEQAKIIRSLPTNTLNYLYKVMGSITDEIKLFDGTYSSRYQLIWRSAMRFGQLSVVRANTTRTILTDAISQNPYFSDWDKDPVQVINSGFYYGHLHRDFANLKEKGLIEDGEANE